MFPAAALLINSAAFAGGSWNNKPLLARATSRVMSPADSRIKIGGFRVARSVP